MSGRRITSVEVAERAGVSQSAVSRVFTPGASVSPAMKRRVLEAADALGYRPNVLARSLITGRTRMIGLAVAYLDNQFYPEAIERLSRALQDEGYHILIFMIPNDEEEAARTIQELMDYQVDGLVMASVAVSNTLAQRCADAGIPVVLFNRGQDDSRLSQVTSDNRAGGRKVAEFLLAGGHRRIAHISGWSGATTGRDRSSGFRDGLATGGQSVVAEAAGMYDRETAMAATRQMFAGRDHPDAVFVGNDHMAFAVMDVLRGELGLSVPDDVSVVGYDDTAVASWAAYDLATIRQPANRMVAETVATIMSRIANPDEKPKKIEIDGSLIVRGSARVPKGWTDEGL